MSDRRRGREEGGSSSGGQSRRSRQKVMDASGQTVEERRQLRLEQRNLKSVIIEQQADIGDLNKDTCRELTEENAKLFVKTNFPREAVTDGENLNLIAQGAVAQVKKVNKGAVGVDGDSFLDRVKGVYSKSRNGEVDAGNEFNWRAWGGSTSVVFLAMPDGGSFMMGPLDKEEKLRKLGQRREKIVDDAKEVIPDEEIGTGRKKAKQNKDQTQTRIANMRDHEKESGTFRTKKDLFETVINPKSFTQTVENMFDLSFLVKSGEAHVSIDKETKLPQVKFDEIQSTATGTAKSKQWLMSFTQADFKELNELYKLQESNIAHRDEGPKSDYYDPLIHGNRESNRQ